MFWDGFWAGVVSTMLFVMASSCAVTWFYYRFLDKEE